MVDCSLFSLDALGARPAMEPDAVIQGETWRIGVLTDSLIRLEWSPDGSFTDEATQTVIDRSFRPVPEYTVQERSGLLVITTGRLTVRYDRRRFSPEGLSITVRDFPVQENTWRFGDDQSRNLGGTARTLDQVDGPTTLEPGVLSKTGWAILDDSSTGTLVEADEVDGEPNPFGTWVRPRTGGGIDLYFFGYGSRCVDAVRDYQHLTGAAPLLPRFVFGNWWSRYHRYSDGEYRALIERFARERIPFSVAVVDMDWHVTDVPAGQGSGWTGYTWNRELFPDPEGFLAWLHGRGLQVTLNVHPRDGVRPFEDCYPQVARAMGIDPASGESVDFDVASPRFMAAYFDLVHHPLEDRGVDFWWVDWQQGGVSRQPVLDPLWLLNHLHYLDSGRERATGERRRPLTFSRYAGPGSQRYPIGFSGDTVVSWDSLKFQPYFTAMASNIGYGWWSHDIGGHMFGRRDEAMAARWCQLGAFSPINRLHSSDSPFNGKEPWNFHAEARKAMEDSLRLRHSMIPYLYAMNRRSAVEGLPLVEPMYWRYSGGNVPTEYLFGTELVVSPIVSPQDPVAQRGRADVWLPQGEWFDFFDGRRYVAASGNGCLLQAWRPLDRMPVFAKAGGIVPLQEEREDLNDVSNPESLRVLMFPGADGAFDLWEDDGGVGDRNRWACTRLRLEWPTAGGGRDAHVVIDGADVPSGVTPARRRWQVVLRGVRAMEEKDIEAYVDGQRIMVHPRHDASTLSLILDCGEMRCDGRLEVTLHGAAVAPDPLVEDSFAVLHDAQMEYFTKERAYALVKDLGPAAVGSLRSLEAEPGEYGEPSWFMSHMPDSVIEALTEVLCRGIGTVTQGRAAA